VVNAVRRTDGWYSLNVAHLDRVEVCADGPLEIESTTSLSDMPRLVQSVAEAEEISTAVPSIRNYVDSGPASIHKILAKGLRRKADPLGPLRGGLCSRKSQPRRGDSRSQSEIRVLKSQLLPSLDLRGVGFWAADVVQSVAKRRLVSLVRFFRHSGRPIRNGRASADCTWRRSSAIPPALFPTRAAGTAETRAPL